MAVQPLLVSSKTPLPGQSFLGKGYCMNTVELNGEMIRQNVRLCEHGSL